MLHVTLRNCLKAHFFFRFNPDSLKKTAPAVFHPCQFQPVSPACFLCFVHSGLHILERNILGVSHNVTMLRFTQPAGVSFPLWSSNSVRLLIVHSVCCAASQQLTE